jgi:hypothetical protein
MFTLGPPPLVTPPSHLPDPESLLTFDVDKKKQEIFRDARLRIKNKAEYTRTGRKPWTQLTVPIPIPSSDTTPEQDLAIIWALMNKSTNVQVKENESGDVTWQLWGAHTYLDWLGLDYKTKKPVDLFVHPVRYESGARRTKLLSNRHKKATDNYDLMEMRKIEKQYVNHVATTKSKKEAQGKELSDSQYHWSAYDECQVIYKKKQTKKKQKELSLTVKIRTYYLGCGIPEKNDGYVGSSSCMDVINPNSYVYNLMASHGQNPMEK